jgi:hypothetical protein
VVLFFVVTWSSHIELLVKRTWQCRDERRRDGRHHEAFEETGCDLISSTNDGGFTMLHHLLGFFGFLECRCKGLQASEILCFSCGR